MCLPSSSQKGSHHPLPRMAVYPTCRSIRTGMREPLRRQRRRSSKLPKGRGRRFSTGSRTLPPAPSRPNGASDSVTYSGMPGAHSRRTTSKPPKAAWRFRCSYTVHEQPSYTIVPSNALWHDPARADEAESIPQGTSGIYGRPCLYFPQVMRDARRMQEYYPGLSPEPPRVHGQAWRLAGALRVEVPELLRRGTRSSACSTRRSRNSCSSSSPDATDALVYNHRRVQQGLRGRPSRKTRTTRSRE